MTIAVVIPALNEEVSLPATLARAASLGVDRIVVVDGGSQDRTREVVDSHTASHARPTPDARITLLDSPRGRGRQMNCGAAACREDVLVFLHADTLLPLDAKDAIEHALADPACVGGRFDVRFVRDRGWSWIIGRLINLRSRWSGIATGDQALFVRRPVFERMGGYREIAIMEDVDFSARLKRMGVVAALRSQVITSFRRWERGGPLRIILLMWALRFLYWAGASPQRLSRYYAMVRE